MMSTDYRRQLRLHGTSVPTLWLRRLVNLASVLLLAAPWLPVSGQMAMPVSAACGHVGTLAGFVALDSTTIVGSTDAGSMAYSLDGGHCWAAAALDKPLAHRLGEFLRDPRQRAVILAGAGGGARIGFGGVAGLLRSTNSGRSWRSVQAGLPTIPFTVSALAASRGVLFVALTCPEETQAIQNGQKVPYQCGTPIFRSIDDGLTWIAVGLGSNQANPNLPGPDFDGSVLTLTTAPSGALYAAASPLDGAAGLYRSVNQGHTWRLVAREDRLKGTSALFVSGAQPVVLAGVGLFNLSGQVLRSPDGGTTWQQVVSPEVLTGDITVLDFVWTTQGLFFCGLRHVFRSTDGGLSWQQLPGEGLSGAGNALLGSTPSGALLLAQIGGFYRSDDAGLHWSRL
jgi:photosystem II stability/assembly factor-like uncharacterized protein